jgi:hypothetical protein
MKLQWTGYDVYLKNVQMYQNDRKCQDSKQNQDNKTMPRKCATTSIENWNDQCRVLDNCTFAHTESVMSRFWD